MFKLVKVKGSSMRPLYREGDFVLTYKIPFLKPRFRHGDTIVFDHPVYGTMIKQVDTVSADGSQLTVTGTHPYSVDSRNFGPVPIYQTVGKILWHIKSPVN